MYILKKLYTTSFNYKGYRCNIFGIPMMSEYSKRSISTTMSRLKRQGFITGSDGFWQITESGKKYFKNKTKHLKKFESPFDKDVSKNLLITFDIPEHRKMERDWFRYHLKKFGYELIQRSVWVGPSPLPKDFIDYLKEIQLEECIETFKLSRPHVFKN